MGLTLAKIKSVRLRYALEVVAFISGAVVMVLEIDGARIVAPYLGSSIYVWTSLIGVVLGSLSLGYYYGGKLADERGSFTLLSNLCLLSSISISLIALSGKLFLTLLSVGAFDQRLSALLGGLMFAPASALLGTIVPVTVKLKMTGLKGAGREVGTLYAISTIGSIFGTFVTGFYLFSLVGSSLILALISQLMIVAALFVNPRASRYLTLSLALMVSAVIYILADGRALRWMGVVERETKYSRVTVFESNDVRYLRVNKQNSSAVFTVDFSNAFEYVRFFSLSKHFVPEAKRALMVGGGAFVFPREFLSLYPEARIDVVEIDPALLPVSYDYFGLRKDPRLNVFFEDGRPYVNRSQEKYDIVFLDAFNDTESVPSHLTTKEFMERLYGLLRDNGIVMANIVSALEGPGGKFFRAEIKTYESIFPKVLAFLPQRGHEPFEPQNIMLVAFKKGGDIAMSSPDPKLNQYLSSIYKGKITYDTGILTDELAPVEKYMLMMREDSF